MTTASIMALKAINSAALFRTGAQGASGLLFSAAVIGGINLMGFGITAGAHTHKLTDLCGSGAFVASATASLYLNRAHLGKVAANGLAPRSVILTLAVGLWGARLGAHLFERILKSDKDPRLEPYFRDRKAGEGWFDTSKSFYPVKLAGFWLIQAAWGWVVSLPVTLTIFNPVAAPVGVGGMIALTTFAGGLAFEAIADYQKRQWRAKPENKGKWITGGVWSLSRHPNYFGEMTVWWSIFAAAYPALKHSPKSVALGLASPLFVSGLLLYVSGIPMLEKKMIEQHKDSAEFKRYMQETPILVPYIKNFPLPGVKYEVPK